MRNVPLDSVDAIERDVLAIGTDYAPGTLLEMHHHRRAQFLYGATGLMEVGTDDGAWVVPPHCGVWIPANKPHRVRMVGVSTRSLYIEPSAAPREGSRCEVLLVSPLLRQLLLEATQAQALYGEHDRDGLVMRLALAEIARAATLPIFAPLPKDGMLHRLCVEFLYAPSIRATAGDWAVQLHRSERTFTRFFRAETGMPFGEWRQHACLISALSRLAEGQPVTAVALELGYDSPGAFSTMFRRRLGFSPSSISHSMMGDSTPEPAG
ncbi:AraC family transcriptional regulator [Variovorax atrisoli]|uniref:AraC family transcriptional regulator n=1 Tax=Variovorax atrisoli TaxID=3394203 RepID=UPI00104D7086|nr:helix-turn-helix transcriptional regulator [Variovorax paradoxus]